MRGADRRDAKSQRREYVRAQPFTNFLNDRIELHARFAYPQTGRADLGPVELLLAEIGWQVNEAGARRLYRYRFGVLDGSENGVKRRRRTEWFRREVVEDALHFAGVDFYSLYPEFAHERDVPLEPETWCPGCRTHVNPIDGECPWCNWRMEPWGLEAAA